MTRMSLGAALGRLQGTRVRPFGAHGVQGVGFRV